jgi:hypothetical protein
MSAISMTFSNRLEGQIKINVDPVISNTFLFLSRRGIIEVINIIHTYVPKAIVLSRVGG